MKLVLDTCVLFPTVMREALLAGAEVAGWVPLWSERILDEWAHAARKIGPTGELQAQSEIALLKAHWPTGSVSWPADLEKRLWLPDKDDIHVLAAAVQGAADAIVTLNAKDFPHAALQEEGIKRMDPDHLLYDLGLVRFDPLKEKLDLITKQAQRMSGADITMKALLKKARLPRLSKLMG